LVPILNKTYIVKFASSKPLTYPLNNVYNNRALTLNENIKFLGMHLYCNLTWKSHTDNLIKKLISIGLMLRKLLPTVYVNILRMVHFVHCYSQIIYGIIIWSSSSSVRSVFIIKKRGIRIMLRLGQRSSCREDFKKLDIPTVPCLYFYALMLFTFKNLNIYQTNSSVYDMNTRQQINCTYPQYDFPQYREMSTIHLLKYSTSYHKIYSNIQC